ncbi:MAG: hypothetical protein AB7O37_10650 [Vicinamibacteria bacterium]
MSRTSLAAGAGALLAAGSLPFLGAAPRFAFSNDGLTIDHRPAEALAAAALALGLWLLASALRRRRAACYALGALGLGAAGVALDLASFRLTVDGHFVERRALLEGERIAWSDVASVESGPAAVLVRGPGDRAIRIEARAMTPDDRATLDRAIARRIRESRKPTTGDH